MVSSRKSARDEPDEDDDDDDDQEDIARWDVDEILKAYSGDRGLKKMVENQFIVIFKFISENGMFKKKRRVVDSEGKLLLREVFDRDLTDEGLAFVRLASKPWFRSKVSGEDPTKTAILEKYLKQIRK